MLLKQTIVNVENIEFDLHSVESSIKYFRALLDASDEIVMKSMQNVVDRTIEITGEYFFETYHPSNLSDDIDYPAPIVVTMGPENTIVEADWETNAVYIHRRGKLIATSKLVEKYYYKFGNQTAVFAFRSNISMDKILRITEKMYLGSIFGIKSGKKGVMIIASKCTNMYDLDGKIIHKYDPDIVGKLYERCKGWFILSDGISVCFHWGKFGKNFYRIIRPV